MAKVTIDELAIMMNNSFTHLEKRLDGVDERLDRVEVKLDNVEIRLDKVEVRLDKIEYRLDTIEGKFLLSHENRISRLEDDMRVLKTQQKNN